MDNFSFQLPTKTYFGVGEVERIGREARKMGTRCLLVTGRRAMRKTGILDRVKSLLADERIEIVLFDRVKPYPDVDMVNGGRKMKKKTVIF